MAIKNTILTPLLQSLDLGASVAEVDSLLEVARIETSAFSDLLTDRVDLVPGTKGSGKSALFRMIVEFLPTYLIRQRKVVVAHGIQAPGDPVFQAFSEQFAELTEPDFVDFWCIYLVSLAYEQFIKKGSFAPMLSSAKAEVNAFRLACSKAGIPDIRAAKSLKDVLAWSLRVLSWFKPRLTHKLPYEAGEIELDMFGNPKPPPDPKTGNTGEPQLPQYMSDIREALDGILVKSELSLWLMVDRLDEVFPRRSETERRALRGLLRAMLLLSSPRLRVKIFLRDDMLDNLVKGGEGFTALTHLTARQADTLRWTNDQITAMLAKRFFSNEGICAAYRVDGEKINASASYRVQCLAKLFPPTVYRGTRQSTTLKWIYDRCADGRGVVTPRDVLELLIRARQKQLDMCSADPDGESDGLLSSQAIRYGLEQLSVHKRRTFLEAEFPHLWIHMEKFVGGKTEYSEASLTSLLGKDSTPVVENLVAIGFLGKKSKGNTYTIPRLYRNGLDLTQGKA